MCLAGAAAAAPVCIFRPGTKSRAAGSCSYRWGRDCGPPRASAPTGASRWIMLSGAAAAAPAGRAVQRRKTESQLNDREDQRRGEVPSFVVSRKGSRGREIEIPSPGVLSLFVHFLFARAKRKWTLTSPVKTTNTGGSSPPRFIRSSAGKIPRRRTGPPARGSAASSSGDTSRRSCRCRRAGSVRRS